MADTFKRTRDMAALTKLPKPAVVDILSLVAADACAAQCQLPRHGFAMAGVAGDALVVAVELE